MDFALANGVIADRAIKHNFADRGKPRLVSAPKPETVLQAKLI